MNNEEVRLRLIKCLIETGVKQLFIADKCGLTAPTFTRFKQGKQDLYNENLEKLDTFLTKLGY